MGCGTQTVSGDESSDSTDSYGGAYMIVGVGTSVVVAVHVIVDSG